MTQEPSSSELSDASGGSSPFGPFIFDSKANPTIEQLRKRRRENSSPRPSDSKKHIKVSSDRPEDETTERLNASSHRGKPPTFVPIKRAPSSDIEEWDATGTEDPCSADFEGQYDQSQLGSLYLNEVIDSTQTRSGSDWERENTADFETKFSQLAVDQPCFKKAESLVASTSRNITGKIQVLKEEEGGTEPEIDSLNRRLETISSPVAGEQLVRYAGASGQTGAGKSKMQGCLLDRPDASKTSSTGESGTDVPWEYAMRNPGTLTKCHAEIIFKTQELIEQIVTEACAECYRFRRLNRIEVGDKVYEEALKCREQELNLLFTLTVGSSSGADVGSMERLESLLNGMRGERDAKVIGLILAEITAYLDSLGRVDGKAILNDDDVKTLRDKCLKYAGPNRDPKTNALARSPWRLVKCIKFYLDAPILEDGLILSDLPGTGDADRTRMETAQEQAASCQILMICGATERFTNQDIIDKEIRTLIRTGRLAHCILVATKIDLIDHDQTQNFSPHENEQIACLRQREETVRSELEKLEESAGEAKEAMQEVDIEDEERARRRESFFEISIQCDTKKTEVDIATAEVRSANIRARNNHIRGIMRERISRIIEKMNGGHLPRMFFLSSNTYLLHKAAKGEKKKKLDLSLWQTGVGPLRQYLRGAPAVARKENLQWAFAELRKLLIAFDLHCSKTRLELKNDVLSLLEGPATKVRLDISRTIGKLKSTFEDIVVAIIEQRESNWIANAKALHGHWSEIHHASFNCICAKGGRHVTGEGISYDLGEDICEHMDWELVAVFEALNSEINKAGKKLRKGVREALTGMEKLLKGIPFPFMK